MIWRAVFLMAIVSVAACGESGTSESTTTQHVAVTAAPTTAGPGTSTSTTPPKTTTTSTTLDNADEAILDFVADVEELLVDTEYEDLVAEDPEVFIATGLLFCERLDGGVSPEDLLIEYVGNLTGDDIAAADDDTLTLAGSILGTAVGYLCSEHSELLDDL